MSNSIITDSEIKTILSTPLSMSEEPVYYRYYFFLSNNPNIAKEDYAYHDNCISYFLEKLKKYNGSYDYKNKDDEKYKLGLKCVKYITQKGSEVLEW